jgi:hypothetical protein
LFYKYQCDQNSRSDPSPESLKRTAAGLSPCPFFENNKRELLSTDDSFANRNSSKSRLLPKKKRPSKYENQQQQLPSISFSVEDVFRSFKKPLRRQEPEDDLSPMPKLISKDDHPTSSSTTTTETSPTAASSADSETCPTTTSEPMMAILKGTSTRDGPEVDDLPDRS